MAKLTMPEQRELPLAFPDISPEAPLIPVRMVNEYVYCPRLAYLMWVQAEWADSAGTLVGRIKHKDVDAGRGKRPHPVFAGVTNNGSPARFPGLRYVFHISADGCGI